MIANIHGPKIPQIRTDAAIEWNIPAQTFKLVKADGSYLTAYLDGEIFFVYVPGLLRTKGIGKSLVLDAAAILKANNRKLSFTSAISPEGERLISSIQRV